MYEYTYAKRRKKSLKRWKHSLWMKVIPRLGDYPVDKLFCRYIAAKKKIEYNDKRVRFGNQINMAPGGCLRQQKEEVIVLE